MASPSPSSSRPSLLPRSLLFIPVNAERCSQIPEHETEEEADDESSVAKEATTAAAVAGRYKHQPTPLHPSSSSTPKRTAPAKPSASNVAEDVNDRFVSCNKCRPSSRDKISVVPLDANGLKHSSTLSPNPSGLLRSLFLSLTRRSPRHVPSSTATSTSTPTSSATAAVREEEWRLAAAELSRRLLAATRKRDEALREAARLKSSVSDLERKLDRLESYCHNLSASLDRCPAPGPVAPPSLVLAFPVEQFVRAVSDARSAVRHLARSLLGHLRQKPGSDRVATLLQPYDPRAAGQWRRNPARLSLYLEAILNRVFYSGLEEEEEGDASVADPAARCEANRAAYEVVRGLGWDEVLSKGTRHYSQGLSRFCDRKMGEVVGLLGWARAWPETLLQAFFGAARGALAVRLLAWSVHPPLPAVRADRGTQFDPRFMEDGAADRAGRLVPASVKMMVAPGFHVYTAGGRVVRCVVLCVYNNSNVSGLNPPSVGVS